jgi:hypothetical protein
MTARVRSAVAVLAVLVAACSSPASRDSSSPNADSASTHPAMSERPTSTPMALTAGDATLPRSPETGVVTDSSCAFGYSAATLAQRSWAFDGTLVSLGTLADSHLGPVASATFSVEHWYRGGHGDNVTVEFEVGSDAEHVQDASPGARLLVAGEPRWGGEPLDEPVAWGCGFSQQWTADAARSWADAFER